MQSVQIPRGDHHRPQAFGSVSTGLSLKICRQRPADRKRIVALAMRPLANKAVPPSRLRYFHTGSSMMSWVIAR